MADLAPGTRLGQYQVTGRLGVGGMATVYRGYHAALDRTVAIKVLPAQSASDEEFMGRFQQEAKTVARLRHPNILEVYDFGQSEDGLFYIVNEYMGGGTLAARLEPPSEPETLLDLVDQLAAGLDYAHAHGVLHRDVKPSNILFSEDGIAVIGDFGLSKMLEGSAGLTRSGVVVGTPEFMAPEQAMGAQLDGRADVYSLGVVLYRLLVGFQPFTGDTPLAVVLAHVQKPLPMPRSLNAALSPQVEAVLVTALEKDPADRYATAGLLADAFRTAVTGVPSRRFGALQRMGTPMPGVRVTALPATIETPAPSGSALAPRRSHPASRRWPLAAGAAAVVAVGALALRMLFFSAGSGPSPTVAAPAPPVVGPTAVADIAPTAVAAAEPTAEPESAPPLADEMVEAAASPAEAEPAVVEVEPTDTPVPIAAPAPPPPAPRRPTATARPAPPPPVAAPPVQEERAPVAAPERPRAQAAPDSDELIVPMGETGSDASAPPPPVVQPAAPPPRIAQPTAPPPRVAEPPARQPVGDVPIMEMGAPAPTPAR